MFEKGDLVVHENSGVCRIDDISTVPGMGDRLYYHMSQINKDGDRIFCPVDNEKVTIRKVLTVEEATALIDSMPSVEPLWVPNEKQRKEIYKRALGKCNYTGWVSIIKTLYQRGQVRNRDGKRITAVDKQFLSIAKEFLYGELAAVFGVPVNEIEPMITARLDAADPLQAE